MKHECTLLLLFSNAKYGGRCQQREEHSCERGRLVSIKAVHALLAITWLCAWKSRSLPRAAQQSDVVLQMGKVWHEEMPACQTKNSSKQGQQFPGAKSCKQDEINVTMLPVYREQEEAFRYGHEAKIRHVPFCGRRWIITHTASSCHYLTSVCSIRLWKG